jgi:4-amino-4-deoxy-L-arabinose transferase-like glycosyltransferase
MHGARWPGRSVPAGPTLAAASLIGLLVVGALIRLLGIDFGRPFAYHPDEGIIVGAAMDMVNDQDWNPHTFFYSSLFMDIAAVVIAVVRVFLGGSSLDRDHAWLFASEAATEQFEYFLAARLVVLLFGVATIAVTFAAATRWRGNGAGIVAAAIVALAPLHIANSRYATTDIPLTFFAAAALWASIEAYARGRDRWWILAGALAGLAMSTKWNGAAVVVVPLTAYLATATSMADLRVHLRRRTPVMILASAAIALLVTTPAIVFDTTAVRDFLTLQAELYARVRPNERSPSAAFNVRALLDGIGIVAAVTGIVGCVAIVGGRDRRAWCIPVFVAIYFVVVSLPATHYERNLLPIVPFLAVAAGGWLAGVVHRARGMGRGAPLRLAAGGLVVVVLVSLVPGLVEGVGAGRRLSQTDTRTIAREWMLDNLPHNAVVARELYTPQVTPEEFRLRNHDFLWQRDWSWYRGVKTRYLVTSSLDYARFVGNPDDPAHDAFYRELFALPEVFRVDPGPDRPGPTIRIFELPRAPS